MIEVKEVSVNDGGGGCVACKDEKPRRVVEIALNGGGRKIRLCKQCKDKLLNMLKKMRF